MSDCGVWCIKSSTVFMYCLSEPLLNKKANECIFNSTEERDKDIQSHYFQI